MVPNESPYYVINIIHCDDTPVMHGFQDTSFFNTFGLKQQKNNLLWPSTKQLTDRCSCFLPRSPAIGIIYRPSDI